MATAKEREDFIARFVAEYVGKPRPAEYVRHGSQCPRATDSAGQCECSGDPYTLQECTDSARSLLRNARTHGNLAEEECNGPQVGYGPSALDERARIDQWQASLEKRQAAVERRIKEVCAEFALPVTLSGDPRGYTVKVKLPSGAYNTWGGSSEGYGVPQ